MTPPNPDTPLHAGLARYPCRVLVIEDDPGIRRAYRRAMNVHLEATVVPSIQVAELVLADSEFEAVVLDLNLPGEDTTVFYEWLRETHPELAAATLVVSGDPSNPEYRDIVSERGEWVLAKPVTPWELRDRLFQLLSEESAAA